MTETPSQERSTGTPSPRLTTTALLARLERLGVRLSVENGELRIRAPKGALTAELRDDLARCKGELLSILAPADPDSASAIPRAPRDEPLPLSFQQQRIWFLDQLEPGQSTYNMWIARRLDGRLDVDAFERAMDEVIRRHEVLRTTFQDVDGVPRQVVAEPGTIRLEYARNDLGLEQQEWQAEIYARLKEGARRPFDLVAGPLFAPALFRVHETEHILFIRTHHTVVDGISVGLLLRELATLYEAFTRGEPSPLPELEIQYADFAAWQRERFAGPELERQMGWWRERLSGELPVLELPTDRPRPRIQTFRGATLKRDLPRDLIDAASQLGRSNGATLFHVLLAAYDVLLHRITGQEDLIVGTAVDNRNRREIEPVIGFFANTLALRADLSGDPSFRQAVARVRDVCLGALDHQELPFEHLVDELAPERSLATTPIFQTFFGLDEDLSEDARFGDLGVGFVILNIQIAHNDLTIFTFLRSDGLAVNAEYNTDLFEPETIERLLESYETVLRSAVADPDRPISRLAVLSEPERDTLLREWNDTASDYPRETTIHRRFEEQVDRTPDAIAAVFPVDAGANGEAGELTYRELDERANRLAHHLIAAGIRPGALVGLCLERSAEMLVAMFGILKTGAAYVPLDPAFPQDRLAHMASDAQLSLVVTQRRLAGLLPSDARLVCVDEEREAIAARDDARPQVETGSDERMYVIYTSGSTGLPKGVEILHRSVSNFLSSMSRAPGLAQGERLLAVTTLSFDIAVLELVLPLVVGATVVVASSEAAADGDRLAALIARERPQAMQATPATWRMLVLGGWKGDRELRILCGGEALPRDLADALLARGREVWNLYGPTEATIWSTVARVEPGEGPITIGGPIESTRAYVLDAHLQPVPIGVTGELYLGGDGLARGYLNRPELTAERFLTDPFVPPGENGQAARIYRTGDLARWRSDGSLECLGRVDTQVKVRGYRIELGEIEAVLGDVDGVRECVAVVREDTPGDRRLVAYLVTEDGAGPTSGDLRAAARAKLPEYMVPAAFVEVDALPLTPNGKVDRKALLAREGDGPSVETEYVEPRDDVERAIVEIWKEILGVDRVGVFDDFFDLGGNSLLTTQVMARVRNTFGVDVQLRTMFEESTAAALAERVAGAAPADAIPIPRASRDEPLPLSFAQERLWFLDQLEPGQATYNMWVARRLEGPLDAAALERTVGEIVRRHEVLRTRFEPVGEGRARAPVQVIGEPDSVRLETVVDGESRPLESWRAEVLRLLESWAREPFDLARGPLFRAKLVRVTDEEHVLFLVAHHTVMDGLSIGLLLGELRTLYEAFTRGEPSPLPELAIQYADYAAWQRKRLRGAELERQMEWWRERLSGDLPVLELPADRPRPAIQTYRGATRRRHLPRSLIDAAGELGRSGGATLFHILLAAYDVLLRRVTGQEDVIVGTAVGNRGRTETEPVMGFFTNTLALRADLSGDPSFRETVARVRDVCLGALDHQELPFERLVDELAPERSLATTPIFQTFFVLDEDLGEDTRIGDLTVGFVDLDIQVAHTDLTVLTYLGSEGLVVSAEYNTDLFDAETIEALLETYEILLKSAVADPDRPIGRLAILCPAQRATLLDDWNDTRTDYPRGSTIQAEFEAWAERTPDAVAAVLASIDGEAHSVTYGELNRHANRLARHLRSLGVGPDDLVGLCTERSLAMLVGILAILKAGGAYLPLDPGYPRERLALMIEDARMSVLLTQDSLRGALPPFDGAVFSLDSDWEACEGESDANPEPVGGPRNLAYAMFTSGSTGRPKGVCVEHRSVLRLVSRPNFARLDADEVLLHFAPISFDASTLEVWGALLKGARVVVYPPSAPSLEDLGRVIRENGVTSAWLTAGLFALMVDQRLEDLRGLRQLLAGGDVLPIPQVNRVLDELPDVRLINGYGPTENTTFTCCHQISDGGRVAGSVPIGKPISDTRVYVLDDHQELVPIGVPGELHVAGDGLARGYLHRPEQTEERFVANPFEPGERMYRTGDVVRWRRDGTIEFFGRRDDQVKVRGFRIELGEIEVVLGAHADVRECVVTVREDVPGDKRLVAYVVPEGERADVAALRRALKERLPEYMHPAAYVTLPALPLSPNGKVDRAALPAPDETRRDVDTAFQAPRNETERRIASIWSEALGLERVGIHDNFFDLGGNSLLTTRVMSDVRASFGTDLPLRHLFEDPTVAGLAGRIDNGVSDIARRSYESEFEASLIPLQPRGTRTPLFLVSGAHANEDDFLRFVGSLLPHMGADQPIYGFKARGLDGVRRPHRSAEEMAADYVKEMRALQPEGPYVLAGNCVGGIVAYEMAQQLRRAGCEVALVALLDTTRPEENYAAFVEDHYRFWKRERFAGHWDQMHDLSPADKVRYVLGKMEKKLSSAVPLTERARRASRIERVEREYSRILARYRAEPYSGRVALIVNEELQRELPDGGWRDVIPEGLETHVVSGDHVTRLSMNGQDTADILRSCIDRALARSAEKD